MKFTERMRESLGHQGPHLRVPEAPPEATPGDLLNWTVLLESGTHPVRVEGFITRLVQAQRQWLDADGNVLEDASDERPSHAHSEPRWERNTIAETTIDKPMELGPNERVSIDLTLEVPASCRASTIACTHMLNVQAVVEGQIDPATNVRLVVREHPGASATRDE